MSNHKKYQIFISSTYIDLKEAREKITKVILDLYHLPVGMEMFSADDDEQWKIITDAIDVSDYYILILGHRYGSLTNKGISYTEKEFNYAKSKGIPILVFVRERDVPTTPLEREDNIESIPKLDKFVKKATTGRVGNFWSDISELEKQVAIALPKSFARHGGVGWIRGDQSNQNVVDEMARLSEENRELRNENLHLKEKVDNKKPSLDILINQKNYSENSVPLTLELPILLEEEKYSLPDKYIVQNEMNVGHSLYELSRIQDFGRKSINDCKKDFNKDLDAVDITHLGIHNDSLCKLKNLKINYENFELSITNLGNSIANEISIEVKFPEDILTILDHGLSYEVGVNARAMKDFEYYQDEISSQMIYIPNLKIREHSFPRSPFGSRNDVLNLPSDFFNFKMENNIELTRSSLLHRRQFDFEKYSIIPLKKGEGKILINIMCAEYDEAQIIEIPINII